MDVAIGSDGGSGGVGGGGGEGGSDGGVDGGSGRIMLGNTTRSPLSHVSLNSLFESCSSPETIAGQVFSGN